MANVSVSVRNLVEFILRNGDIDQKSGVLQDVDAMQAGSRAHRKLQKSGGSKYQAEVALKQAYVIDETLTITVEGRADGIITDPKDEKTIMIDEIKGTFTPLDVIEAPDVLHLAQADCYAAIYVLQNHLEKIGVRITYIHLESEQIKIFEQERTAEEIQAWMTNLVHEFARWARWQIQWNEERNRTITAVKFPYEFRDSQKRMMNGVYRSIEEKKNIFIQAPTGTGKTLGTLFPAIKQVPMDRCGKIFYLTAKTIVRTVAEESGALLHQNGLRMKFVTLTAKEKICPLDECLCQPEVCERAKGHFDRVNDAIFHLINEEDLITRPVIESYAEKYCVCPFEFQLDVSLWCDVIIGDYNYVFDPLVYLKRFFSNPQGNYVFLVDEAHNLIDRAREMYSAVLYRYQFDLCHKELKKTHKKLAGKIQKCGQYMKDFEEQRLSEDRSYKVIHEIGSFVIRLMRMVSDLELLLREEIPVQLREHLTDLYFAARKFINAYDLLDDKFVIYTEGSGGETSIKIYCIDPSVCLNERIGMSRSCVFFSATLLPIQYYEDLLSKEPEQCYEMYVDSPFSKENRLIFSATDVSSKYTARGRVQYEKIATYIQKIIRGKNGNYIAFFPSYVFMQEVFEIFSERELVKAGNGIRVFCQEPGMDENARQEFLDHFKTDPHETTLGFCVQGGIFSEGIDLKADRLIGVIIVGTGLPGLTSEREILRTYFDEKKGRGFDYAYLYPGMNKVLQAGGRVIRSESDRGIIALLDERFNYSAYQRLFPREWLPCLKTDLNKVEEIVENMWTE